MSKLSIITNFGCEFDCPYCITRQANSNLPKTKVEGLERLPDAVSHFGADALVISGGGDPLNNFDDHWKWWEKILEYSESLNVPIELHTSRISFIKDIFIDDHISRIVLHARSLKDLFKVRDIYPYTSARIRVVFVVTSEMTEDDIKFISKFYELGDGIDELSFRQLVDENFEPYYYHDKFLKMGHEQGKWYYIQQNDYRNYYSEGKVYSKYSDLVKGINAIDY